MPFGLPTRAENFQRVSVPLLLLYPLPFSSIASRN